MKITKIGTFLRMCVLVAAFGLISSAAQAALVSGTYEFSGTCLDCLRDSNNQVIEGQTPAHATLVVEQGMVSAFSYQSNLFPNLFAVIIPNIDAYQVVADIGPVDQNTGYADALISIFSTNFGYHGFSTPVQLLSSGITGEWQLIFTEYRTEDFGISGTWSAPATVPEPATLLIVATALFSLILIRCRHT